MRAGIASLHTTFENAYIVFEKEYTSFGETFVLLYLGCYIVACRYFCMCCRGEV